MIGGGTVPDLNLIVRRSHPFIAHLTSTHPLRGCFFVGSPHQCLQVSFFPIPLLGVVGFFLCEGEVRATNGIETDDGDDNGDDDTGTDDCDTGNQTDGTPERTAERAERRNEEKAESKRRRTLPLAAQSMGKSSSLCSSWLRGWDEMLNMDNLVATTARCCAVKQN